MQNRDRDRDVESRPWTQQGKEKVLRRGSRTTCGIGRYREAAVLRRKPSTAPVAVCRGLGATGYSSRGRDTCILVADSGYHTEEADTIL